MNIRRRLFFLLIVTCAILMMASSRLARMIGPYLALYAQIGVFVLIEGAIFWAMLRAQKRKAPRGEMMRYWLMFGLMAVSLVACAILERPPATPVRLPWVFFQNLTIDGRPAQLILDTGGGFTSLGSTGANGLGVKVEVPKPGEPQVVMKSGAGTWIWSDPVRLSFGDQTFTLPLYIGTESNEQARFNRDYGIDGGIGWPEVCDNILVFDPRRHTIRAVKELPAETAGWIKVNVRRDQSLLIDLPFPNGKTGAVLVDTGFQIGVGLPREQWIAWRSAHPQESVNTNRFHGDYLGSGNVEAAWPDEFTFGGFTFSHVMVMEAPPAMTEAITNFSGMLGLMALERMDLVVDGPGGYAYIKPRPSSDPPSNFNVNWSVDSNVRLSDASMLAYFHGKHGLDKPK